MKTAKPLELSARNSILPEHSSFETLRLCDVFFDALSIFPLLGGNLLIYKTAKFAYLKKRSKPVTIFDENSKTARTVCETCTSKHCYGIPRALPEHPQRSAAFSPRFVNNMKPYNLGAYYLYCLLGTVVFPDARGLVGVDPSTSAANSLRRGLQLLPSG